MRALLFFHKKTSAKDDLRPAGGAQLRHVRCAYSFLGADAESKGRLVFWGGH